ncbi:hypothetical protein F4778DRAFT_778411 [Xylariomycetidae sp. FL2044]|nr:hypothetical protein F4778DRAFT_778411 [Xylariomycetidae sp. FL2044]
MGVDSKAPPLPAPTETESLTTPTEAAPSDVSKTADEKSHYSLPDDGTPVTIKTRGHRPNRSQTSLLIEYFEGGKSPRGSPDAAGRSSERRPSVRVRLTPSKARGKNDHIQITETKSSRKASLSRKATASPNMSRSELEALDPEDARSMHSYASATEESNVSRGNPIEVEIDPGHHHSRRRRKPSSPLIPAADSKASSYLPPNMSDISGIPTDSFLDGSGATGNTIKDEKRARSPLRSDALAAGALGAVTAAVAADKMNRKTRSDSQERKVIQKAVEKATKPERRHKSKSRTSSISEKDLESRGSPRRRSKGTHKESVVSGADSSVVSSQMTGSHRSYDSHSSSKISINNPKLLETVEDAIRRLILPELDAIKRERSQRDTRRSRDRDSLSSLTSASRDELSVTSKRKSADTAQSIRSKDKRDREARNQLSPQSSIDHVSVHEEAHEEDQTPRRDRDRLTDAALGAAVVGAALRSRSRGDEKRQRRRRRGETPKREHGYTDDYDDVEHEVVPPMPLSSEINPSDLTRTSILSADTDRPHSASEEMTPVREVKRGVASMESMEEAPTPTQESGHSLQSIGTQHANISQGDLRALPRKGTAEYKERFELDELGNRYIADDHDDYEDEYDESGHLAEPGMYDEEPSMNSFYGSQDVPAPLRYVPYQQERRGLSPIQSVSGYTEGESDVQGQRDSRTIHTASEVSSPTKSPYRERGIHSPNSVPSNMRSREFGDDGSSVRSSGLGYRNTTYTDDSELDRVASGQAVQMIGGNPQMVHQNFGPESAVASLVDSSVLDPSVLSGSGGTGQEHHDSQVSYGDGARGQHSREASPSKRSVDSHHEFVENHEHSPAHGREYDGSNASREFAEYEVNEYGQKVPEASYRHSPTASETAITSAALGRAAAAAAALKRQNEGQESPSAEASGTQTGGVFRNRSFKERAKDGFRPNATPRHSVDRLSDYSQPRMGATGLPDMDYPEPEIGYGYDEDHRSEQHTPSVVTEPLGGSQYGNRDHWPAEATPAQYAAEGYDLDRTVTPKASKASAPGSGHGLGIADAAAAATLAAVGAMAASHSRQPSQEQDDEWQRTSGDHKRDTLVTNPYEGASPIANLPGIDENILSGSGMATYRGPYLTGSPGLPVGDEGYISADVRDAANGKGKEIPTSLDDPFFASKEVGGMSGMSQGMRTPLFDPATGTGIDRIQSKDIIALMEHLMVRDAQRSARDTEILVTLVRSAADMRNSFEDIKRMLADSEDQIITEVKDNTEKTVKRHLGGPRPFPGSSARSFQGGSQAGGEDANAKKRNLLRRALQGLSAKGHNDLGRIEDMLLQLLTDVDFLKHQSAGPSVLMGTRGPSVENLQPAVAYEQDRGYEPEGNAGTSTASHASQSGHLSIPQSRGTSVRMGNDRKFSDHRISTVPEAEDEYDDRHAPQSSQYLAQGDLLSPGEDRTRGASEPLGTPPHHTPQAQHFSASNENTPRTDDGKKHKSRGSSSFFPKISRWSETTTSSIGRVFRNSNNSRKQEQTGEFLQSPPSRSGSDMANYDRQGLDYGEEDQLHTGFSEQDLHAQSMSEQHMVDTPPTMGQPPATYATPEDPKYRAHRNSVNLQHPQPRPGQTQRFRTALETSAQDYDSPMSPRSADWAGSATSLHRFPTQHPNRYSDNSAMHSGQGGDDYINYDGTSSPQAPPRPPKEPLDNQSPASVNTPPQHTRVNKLQKKQHSPLPYQSVESGYGTATATHVGSYHSGSPKLENRNLSGALGVPTRKPSGPRAMTPTRSSDDGRGDERRRKRDTFGTVASPSSAMSQESETF